MWLDFAQHFGSFHRSRCGASIQSRGEVHGGQRRVGGQQFFVCGGQGPDPPASNPFLRDCDNYDGANWWSGTSIPGQGRGYACAARVGDYGWSFGGAALGIGEQWQALDRTSGYGPGDSWTTGPTLPGRRAGGCAASLWGSAYLMDGVENYTSVNSPGDFLEYMHQFTPEACVDRARMPNWQFTAGLIYSCAASVRTCIYLFGGLHYPAQGTGISVAGKVWQYDLTNTWTFMSGTADPFLYPGQEWTDRRYGHGACRLGQNAYFFGGRSWTEDEDETEYFQGNVTSYSPTDNAYTIAAAELAPLRTDMAVVECTSMCYLVGGDTRQTPFGPIFRNGATLQYSAGAAVFVVQPDMPAPARSNHVGV